MARRQNVCKISRIADRMQPIPPKMQTIPNKVEQSIVEQRKVENSPL